MTKNRNPDDATIDRWIQQGDGQGVGLAYKPFFHVRDIPSIGRSSILEGLKVKRSHHYLSDVEYYYHLLAEFSSSIVEIREQYALLPRTETSQIANVLGIQHPRYKNGVLRVLTSDLVLTVRQKEESYLSVLCCKVEKDVARDDPECLRTLEKISLEAEYWRRRNVEWNLVTEAMLPLNKAKNLDFFRPSIAFKYFDHLNRMMPQFLTVLAEHKSSPLTLNEIANESATALELTVEDIFILIGRAIWTKRIHLDLNQCLITHETALPAFEITTYA